METTLPQVHIRFNGQSYDTDFVDLDLHANSTDQVIKESVARYLDIPVGKLESFIVDHSDTGDLTIRPSATFGILIF